MTAALFEEHVCALDRKTAKDSRKVMFVVDNCPGRGKINLAAVTLEFLPVNTTSVLLPMDQGVIEIARKYYYRKSLLHQILLSYDNRKKYEIDLLGAVCGD